LTFDNNIPLNIKSPLLELHMEDQPSGILVDCLIVTIRFGGGLGRNLLGKALAVGVGRALG